VRINYLAAERTRYEEKNKEQNAAELRGINLNEIKRQPGSKNVNKIYILKFFP